MLLTSPRQRRPGTWRGDVMTRYSGWLVTSAGLVLSLLGILPAAHGIQPVKPKAVPTDRFGDPLPAGASARLRTERGRAGDQYTAVVFSPDGHSLISGGQDKLIRV